MTALLALEELSVQFPTGSAMVARLRRRPPPLLTAVDGVSLQVDRGASVGIVGESGCGKSTLARALVGLVPISSGTVTFDGQRLTQHRKRATQRRMQMVFQDPGSALNPARTIGQTLSELLRVHRMVPSGQVGARARELLDLVELPPTLLDAYPRKLSGGQRQRVGIARALALDPDVLIADESVAALDVSVQASILNLLSRLRVDLGITLLFISHDLAVVRHISERTLVMYLGRIVEDRPTRDIFADPRHPYTKALLAAAPRLEARKEPGSSALAGEPPALGQVPAGCRFHPRCPQARDICRTLDPGLSGPASTQQAACHYAWTTDDVDTYPGLLRPKPASGPVRAEHLPAETS
jgi:oligopeptide/dipeptide ABC transporter ATP-binding protein